MVQPQRAAQACQVGVVDRPARRFGRPVQVAELDVDGVAARGKAAAEQHRRRVGGGPHHAGTRDGVLDGTAERCDRVAEDVPHCLCGTVDRLADATSDGAGQSVDPLPHKVVGRQVLRDRHRRICFRRRISLQVVEIGEHLHPADTVGDGVAEVNHHRGPAPRQSLDERGGPQRSRDVER